jgi:hypothetical protein
MQSAPEHRAACVRCGPPNHLPKSLPTHSATLPTSSKATQHARCLAPPQVVPAARQRCGAAASIHAQGTRTGHPRGPASPRPQGRAASQCHAPLPGSLHCGPSSRRIRFPRFRREAGRLTMRPVSIQTSTLRDMAAASEQGAIGSSNSGARPMGTDQSAPCNNLPRQQVGERSRRTQLCWSGERRAMRKRDQSGCT